MPLADSHRESSLAGLTLDDVLANRAAAAASSHQLTNNRRTLLDIIREDEASKKDRKSWKAFKDKLRLKRTGSAWTSSVLIPASDIPISIPIPVRNNRDLYTQFPRRSSVRILTLPPVEETTHSMADPTEQAIKSPNLATISRQRSTRQVADAVFVDDKLKPQMSHPNSARLAAAMRADSIRRDRVVTFRDPDSDDDEDGDGHRQPKEERQMSAREAVAAQEAAEAAAMAEDDEEEEDEDDEPFGGGGGGVTMSLMDLLEETDRQMGLEGSTYRMEDDDDEDLDEDEDDEEEDGKEHDCCVCMVKHRGAAFVPCGHSFCRMCSRELAVSKGNCPLCNNFILEILEVF